MINLGVSSSCLYPLETEKSLEFLGKNGVKTVEIFFNALCELEKPFVNELKAIIDEYGITVSSIHPTMSLSESFMFFSAYQRRYDEGLDQYKRYAQISCELGGDNKKFIIMHGGKPNNVLDDYGYCERFATIAEAVRENGAELLQENVVKYRAGNLEMLKYMKETLGDGVSFCIDVKQCVRGGYTPFEAIDAVGNRLKHLHISDNNGACDCMLPCRGTFDFSSLFKKAESVGFCGNAIIEVYKDAYKDYSEIIDSYKNFSV